MTRWLSTLIAAAGGILASAGAADAQRFGNVPNRINREINRAVNPNFQRGNYNNGYYGPNRGYYDRGYYDRGYYYDRNVNQPYRTYYYGPNTTYQRGYYYAPQGRDQIMQYGNGNEAWLSVRVPPDAEVWIEGDKTQQDGEFREFISPPLKDDKNYTYHLKATWNEDGKKVERKRTVQVAAGQRATVDFFNDRSANDEANDRIKEEPNTRTNRETREDETKQPAREIDRGKKLPTKNKPAPKKRDNDRDEQ